LYWCKCWAASNEGYAPRFTEQVREFGEALEQWTAEDGDELRSTCLQNRGLCYQKMERLEEAERDFSAAVEIDPTSPSPHVNRGGVLYLLGQTSAALADFQRYLDLDPEDNLGMHDAVRTHITQCAPPDDLAGGGAEKVLEDEVSADGESSSSLDSDTEGDEESPLSPSLRRGRSIPQRSTGPTDEWLNSTNIPRPQRWERHRAQGPQPPRGSSDLETSLLRVSSDLSQRWYKQAAVCGALAVLVIALLLIFALV
jgi:tetratricopeptide (TPR) repeat protein